MKPILILSALTLSLAPSAWVRTDVVDGLYAPAPAPTAIPGGWSVGFPDASTGRFLARVQTNPKKKLSIGGTLTVTFRIVTTGAPTFSYNSEPFNTCIYPVNVHPHFYMTRQVGDVYGWWYHPNPEPVPNLLLIETNLNNTTTITAPLIASQWSNNRGQQGDADPTAFESALNNVDTLGVSIGGGCFFGHGVNVSGGTAELQVLGYAIQ